MCEQKEGEKKDNGDLNSLSVPAFVAGVQADLRTYGLTLKKVYGYMEDQLRLYTYLALSLHDETIKAIQDMYNEEVCYSLCVSVSVSVCVCVGGRVRVCACACVCGEGVAFSIIT